MIVLSPHYDDAVLALGQTMLRLKLSAERLVVVTVMGAAPNRYPPLTDRPHDYRCGFGEGDDVVAERRAEDAAVLKQIGAQQVWLDFVDGGYMQMVDVDEIRSEIESIPFEGERVYAPLGLGHHDHVLVRAAADRVATHLYVEAGYRYTHARDVELELELLDRHERLDPTPMLVDVDPAAKLPLVAGYESQLRGLIALSAVDSLTGPEIIWRLR